MKEPGGGGIPLGFEVVLMLGFRFTSVRKIVTVGFGSVRLEECLDGVHGMLIGSCVDRLLTCVLVLGFYRIRISYRIDRMN